MRLSLRLRLFLASALTILGALGMAAVGLSLLFERHVERRIVTELKDHLQQIIAGFECCEAGAYFMARSPADPRFEHPFSGLYWQAQTRKVLLRSRSLWDATLELPPDQLGDDAVHRHRIPGPDGKPLLSLERSILLPQRLGGDMMRAVVAVNVQEVRQATHAFARDLLPYLAMLALLLIAASWVQVWVGLQPLAAVRRQLVAIGAGRVQRLGQHLPQEILPLAAEVDTLLADREMAIAKARARAADLAHGLKTPLQVLLGDVAALRQRGETECAARIEHVVLTMRRHVERELARTRSAAAQVHARCNVGAVTRRVLAVVERTPAGERLQWQLDIPDGLVARIDQDDLAEALGNLTENAARHATRRVTVVAQRRDDGIEITVGDDGPGIPAGHLLEALRRGGRFDRLGEGAGLGLAIVQDIAQTWGGQFAVRSSEHGLRARLIIPLG